MKLFYKEYLGLKNNKLWPTHRDTRKP